MALLLEELALALRFLLRSKLGILLLPVYWYWIVACADFELSWRVFAGACFAPRNY